MNTWSNTVIVEAAEPGESTEDLQKEQKRIQVRMSRFLEMKCEGVEDQTALLPHMLYTTWI